MKKMPMHDKKMDKMMDKPKMMEPPKKKTAAKPKSNKKKY